MDVRAEIIRLVAAGYSIDGSSPGWCEVQAERLLGQYERETCRPARNPCRTCGGSLTPDPASLPGTDH